MIMIQTANGRKTGRENQEMLAEYEEVKHSEWEALLVRRDGLIPWFWG